MKHHEGSNPLTMSYDAGNRITTSILGSSQFTTFTHDANGNLTGERCDYLSVLSTFVYDSENRCLNELRSSGAHHTYTYAPDGLRRSAHHGGAANPVSFVWDGDDLLNEYRLGGVFCRYDVLDGEVFGERRDASRYLYVPDPLGSMNHLLDTSQTIAGTYVYFPYGEVQSHTGPDTPLQFVGGLGYYTGVVNRAYVRARWYRPDLARWQTRDPMPPGEDAASPYEYAGGTPCVAVDPTGLEFISWCCVRIRGRCYGCCRGEPKCPPRRRPRPVDPVTEMCVVLCGQMFGLVCRFLPRGASQFCDYIARYGCRKACEDRVKFRDCWRACRPKAHGYKCVDCCNTFCDTTGDMATCYNMCCAIEPGGGELP